MLGAIAITSGVRNLNSYIADMKNRQQSQERIDEVTKALQPFYDKLVKKETNIVRDNKYFNSNQDLTENVGSVNINLLKQNSKDVVEEYKKKEEISEEKKKFNDQAKDMKQLFKDDIPNELICPITEEIFFDPVMTSDGQTYERKAIEIWLRDHDTSPISNSKLPNKNLIPNFVIKKLVNVFFNKKKINLI